MIPIPRAIDEAIAKKVLDTLLWPRAQPPQLKPEFQKLLACHVALTRLGFVLIAKRERDEYGRKLETGDTIDPILLWLQERVLVKIKPRGEPPNDDHKPGLAHMSVCLLNGRTSARRLDTSKAAEVGMFDPAGLLRPSRKHDALQRVPWELQKRTEETWADATHFLFPDLVCDDSGIDALEPVRS